MDQSFSQIVKVRFNKASNDYSVTIPFELRSIAKGNKYLECKYDPETGGIIYVPLARSECQHAERYDTERMVEEEVIGRVHLEKKKMALSWLPTNIINQRG
jgi:hypothetical protein